MLAGIGHINEHQKKNFLVVDGSEFTLVCFYHLMTRLYIPSETQVSTIEAAFQEYTERKDIAIVLINQHVSTHCLPLVLISNDFFNVQIAEKIRPTVDKYQQAFPALLEIPSKDHPYDPEKDSVLKRVQKMFGE